MSISKELKQDLEKIVKEYKPSKHKKILEEIKSAINKKDSKGKLPADRTITSRYSVAKKMLSAVSKDAAFIASIKPKDSLTAEVIKENKDRRDGRKLKTITEETMKKIIALKDSSNTYDLFLYLLLVSGRRVKELKNSTFENEKGKLVRMKGVLKTRDANAVCSFRPLIPKTSFFKLYSKLLKEITAKKIKTFEKNLSNRCEYLFGKEMTPHTLRSIYVNYMFKFDNKEQLTMNAFIQKYLCHKSLEASFSYNGIVFDFEKAIKLY